MSWIRGVVLFTLVVPSAVAAQRREVSPREASLPATGRGQLKDGRRLVGRLTGFKGDTAILRSACVGQPCHRWNQSDLEIGLADLARLEYRQHSGALNGAAAGFGVGALLGVLMAVAGPDPDDISEEKLALFMGGILGGIGGVAGLAIGSRVQVWVRNRLPGTESAR